MRPIDAEHFDAQLEQMERMSGFMRHSKDFISAVKMARAKLRAEAEINLDWMECLNGGCGRKDCRSCGFYAPEAARRTMLPLVTDEKTGLFRKKVR